MLDNKGVAVVRERNLQLDLLRAVAILAVLICHTTLFRNVKPWWDTMFVLPLGTGVDMFFVLSGFLISGLLFSEFQKTGLIRFRRFAVRRALKLYPPLYVLVVTVTITRLIHTHFHNIR